MPKIGNPPLPAFRAFEGRLIEAGASPVNIVAQAAALIDAPASSYYTWRNGRSRPPGPVMRLVTILSAESTRSLRAIRIMYGATPDPVNQGADDE